MPTPILRLCLVFAFVLCAGCLGGPKVDPPGISDGERSGGSGTYNTGGSEGAANDVSMDSGTAQPTEGPVTSTGGTTTAEDDSTDQSDADFMDDDDAGSIDVSLDDP